MKAQWNPGKVKMYTSWWPKIQNKCYSNIKIKLLLTLKVLFVSNGVFEVNINNRNNILDTTIILYHYLFIYKIFFFTVSSTKYDENIHFTVHSGDNDINHNPRPFSSEYLKNIPWLLWTHTLWFRQLYRGD